MNALNGKSITSLKALKQNTLPKRKAFVNVRWVDAHNSSLNGYIVVNGRDIEAIGDMSKGAEIVNDPDLMLVDAKGFILIPGLINAHVHSAMTYFRGFVHDKESMIEDVFFPVESSLTEEMVEVLSYPYIYDALRSGTTCLGEHYYFAKGVARSIDRFGMRGGVGETIADLGGAFPSRERWNATMTEIENWSHSDRIFPVIAPHATNTVSASLLKEMISYANSKNIPVHMHLSQSTFEYEQTLQREGVSPVQHAINCGLAGETHIGVHLVTASQDDLKVLKDQNISVTLCPVSQIIYEKLAPIKSIWESGVSINIATDCAASNDGADLFSELKTAAVLFKDRCGLQKGPDPKELLAMTTCNPAKALGQTRLGSLKAGNIADIVFLEEDLSILPNVKQLENIIYSINSRQVCHVMIDGDFALWSRSTTKVSESDLRESYEVESAKMLKKLNQHLSLSSKK